MKKPTRQELETLLQKRTTECDQLRCFLYDLINGKALRATIGDSTWLISRPASPDTGIAITFFKREDAQGTWRLYCPRCLGNLNRFVILAHCRACNNLLVKAKPAKSLPYWRCHAIARASIGRNCW